MDQEKFVKDSLLTHMLIFTLTTSNQRVNPFHPSAAIHIETRHLVQIK